MSSSSERFTKEFQVMKIALIVDWGLDNIGTDQLI
ncbi:MAG: hypothetical protein ACJA10_000444 [Oleispira sp.]|jgi:hypothetical protein